MAAKQQSKAASGAPRQIRNAKAYHNFFVGQTFEAGIKLLGTEIKSLRAGKAQLSESFVRIDSDNVPTLYNAHIDEYSHGTDANHRPTRPRLLLLNAKEIRTLKQEMEAGGQALIPTRLYFKEALVKVEIALCKPKKLFDKRDDMKKRVQERETERALSARSMASRQR